MLYRQFKNTANLTPEIAKNRIQALDPAADVIIYPYSDPSGNPLGTYVSVDSTLTDSQITTAITPAISLIDLQANLMDQMSSLMVQDIAIPICVLYLSESALVTAGVITDGQRTITAALSKNYALYLRSIAQAYIAAKSNPTSVTWPTPPVMPF